MNNSVFDSLDKPIPGIRGDLDIIPVEHEGKKYLFFNDMLGYTTQNFALDVSVAPVLTMLNGRRNITDIHDALSGNDIKKDEILRFIRLLDEHYILYSQNFREFKEETETAFERSDVRPAVCSGKSYPDNESAIRTRFDEAFRKVSTVPVKHATALYAPHIDPRVGLSSYAKAFSPIRNLTPKRIVLLATSHYAGLYGSLYENRPFIVSQKHFETPLGTVKNDLGITGSLIENGNRLGISGSDRAHRIEHSIELHLIFLKYLWSHDFKLVPILVNSFQELLYLDTGSLGRQVDQMAAFLRDQFQNDDQTLFLISGDLAHFGRKFGDDQPATDYFDEVRSFDDRFLRCASEGSPVSVLAAMKDTLDRYRICGFPPLLTYLKAFPNQSGDVLSYDLWDERERESAVSFGSVLFKD